jgi:hypothetical protein
MTAAAVLVAAACAFPIPDLDLEAPRVVTSLPVGTASTTPEIVLEFSRPILRESLEVNNAFILLKTEDVSSALLTDLNNPPLIASRQPLLVDGTLNLSEDGTRLSFIPARPLDGETSYTYLLSRSVTDLDENPLTVPLLDEDGQALLYPENHPVRPGEPVYVMGHFRAEFVTGAALEVEGPVVVERFPAAGAQNVPPNLASVRVRFNEPAFNVTPATFQVMRQDGTPVGASEVLVTDGRLRAELILAETLDLSTEYRMVLRADIVDGIGNRLDEQTNESTFGTAACEDEVAPELSAIEVTPVDTYAIVRWRATEPATSAVRYGEALPTLLAEGDAGRCALVNYDPCAEPPMDAVCSHEVRIDGLTPETEYVFEVESVDAAGNAAVSDVSSFTTLPPLPPLVVNEIQATPDIAPQEAGEFVEIYNAGDEAVDLAGWIIADASASPPRTQTLQALGPHLTVIEPGEYALIVGQAFDTSEYPTLATNVILSGTSGRLLSFGLADDRGLIIELRTPEGAMVSSFGGWLRGRDNRGRSIERIDATGPDVRENWTWALETPGATPGYRNSVATGP